MYVYIDQENNKIKKNQKAYLSICFDLGKYLEKLDKVKEKRGKERGKHDVCL